MNIYIYLFIDTYIYIRKVYILIICVCEANQCNITLQLTFNDSAQDGVKKFFSGSGIIGLMRFLNNSTTASIMRVMRYGGFPSFLTVAISAALMVCKFTSDAKITPSTKYSKQSLKRPHHF